MIVVQYTSDALRKVEAKVLGVHLIPNQAPHERKVCLHVVSLDGNREPFGRPWYINLEITEIVE